MVNWENLGIGFAVFSATLLIIVLLFYAMKCSKMRCFSRHNHVFQLLLTFIFSIGVIVSVYEAFGYQMAASLLTGLGISLGLALRPIIQKMVAGMVFDTTIKQDSRIKVGKYTGTVKSVGVVHTIIKTDEGHVCIHNDYFNTNPVTIFSEKSSSTEDPQSQEMLLKYW